MKTFKYCLLIIALVSFTSSYGQRIGLLGGVNFSNVSAAEGDIDYSDQIESLTGFHLGITVEIPFNDYLSLEPALMIQTKGAEFNEIIIDEEVRQRIYLLNTDIPVNLRVRIPLGLVKPYAEAGPYIGWGVFGVNWFTVDGEDDAEEVTWGGEDGQFKRLDYGLNFGGGLEIGRFVLGASYWLGLANISNFENSTVKNRVVRVSIGVKFGQR